MSSKTSLLGNIWKLKDCDERQSLMISQRHNLSLLIAKLINIRNIPEEQIDQFLNPELKNYLPDDCNKIIVDNVLVVTAKITEIFYPDSVSDDFEQHISERKELFTPVYARLGFLGKGSMRLLVAKEFVDLIRSGTFKKMIVSYAVPLMVLLALAWLVDFTDSPIHILIGELDEWTPSEPCIDLVDLLDNNGVDIDITVYEDAHHSFDRAHGVVIAEGGYSFTNCKFKMNDQGAVLMNFLDIPMTNWFTQMIGFAMCADRDPHFGGHPEARKSAFQFSENFMRKYLLE